VLAERRYLRHLVVDGLPQGGLAIFRVQELEAAEWTMSANREETRFSKI
jgi:hypothetical protein